MLTLPKACNSWPRLVGNAETLKYAKRELVNLDAAIKHVPKSRRDVVVQAGGNLGVWPKYLAGFFKRVLTFEPDPLNFRVLQRNAPEANIEAAQAALGEKRGSVGLSNVRRDGSNGREHPGIVHVSGDGDVAMWPLDELQLQECGLIYLDMEGYELYALRGAVETIQRCKPAIAIEVNKNLGFFGLTVSDVDLFFEGQGYRLSGLLGSNDRLYLPESVN